MLHWACQVGILDVVKQMTEDFPLITSNNDSDGPSSSSTTGAITATPSKAVRKIGKMLSKLTGSTTKKGSQDEDDDFGNLTLVYSDVSLLFYPF